MDGWEIAKNKPPKCLIKCMHQLAGVLKVCLCV